MKNIFLSFSIKIAYFLVGFYGMSTVYLVVNELYGKAMLSLLLTLVFLGTIIINKMTLITKEKISNLNKLVSILKKREPDLTKLNLLLFCLDIEFFRKYNKTLTGFFWIKKQNRPYSNFVENALLKRQELDDKISIEVSDFLEENQELFSLSLLELNAKIQSFEKFNQAKENSLLVNLK